MQASIQTEKKCMVFSYSYRKYCPSIGISTGEYIVFYQGEIIDHCTHVPGPVAQCSDESYYNSACAAGMDLTRFSILKNEFLNKDPDMVPKQAHLIIFNIKSSVCMAKNGIRGPAQDVPYYLIPWCISKII